MRPQTNKQITNRRRHKFLLTFFSVPYKYEAKEINGFVLVCQLNKANNPEGEWEVAIFEKDAYQSMLEKRNTLFPSQGLEQRTNSSDTTPPLA